MGVLEEIARINDNILSSYIACAAKSAAISVRNSDNLPNTIMSIPQKGSGDTLDSYIAGGLTVIDSDATTVKDSAFYHDIFLSKVTLNSATEIGTNAFYECSGIEEINIPKATRIKGGALMLCTKLERLILPKVRTIDNSGVRLCASLKLVDFSDIRTIEVDGFNGCSNLNTIIIRNPTKPTLTVQSSYDYFLRGTPFSDVSGNGGTVYVPSDLLSEYQNDTRWNNSLLKTTFKAIEGSIYE